MKNAGFFMSQRSSGMGALLISFDCCFSCSVASSAASTSVPNTTDTSQVPRAYVFEVTGYRESTLVSVFLRGANGRAFHSVKKVSHGVTLYAI